jgi:hypothetical protein
MWVILVQVDGFWKCLFGRSNRISHFYCCRWASKYFGGNSDAFLVKFNSSGIRQWATYYGGSGEDVGQSCVVDASRKCLFGWLY